MNIKQNIGYKYRMRHCRYIGMLFIFFLKITIGLAQNQPISIVENDNPNTFLHSTCIGETKTYTLQNAVNGVNYTWVVLPAGLSNLIYLPNNQVQITFTSLDVGDIYESNLSIRVYGSDATYSEYEQYINPNLNPYITTNSEVGCQATNKREGSDNVIVDNENGCMNVCEKSTVNYHANSIPTDVWYSHFVWTVVGGVFSPSGLTTLTGSYDTPISDVTVIWGTMGVGSITVREENAMFCKPGEKTICIKKIETPKADFIFDNISPENLPQNECYKICSKHEVNFLDLSVASADSPILYYEWDFGDNSPSSALQNPSHVYDTPGEYLVNLKVTNKCGCSSGFKRLICVSKEESPQIFCPSVVCEGNTAIYYTNSRCDSYKWETIGGTIQEPQGGSSVTVVWDQVDSDGFGYVSLYGEPCEGHCPSWSTVRVPVIKAIGTIVGSETVCTGTRYRYKLPAWPATNFTWEILDHSNTGTIAFSNTENGNELEIMTGNNLGMFDIKCTYVNTIIDCPGAATLRVNMREKPTIIAPLQSCINTDVDLQLGNYVGYTYTTQWSIVKPDGSIFNINSGNGQNQLTIQASIFAVEGNYTIRVSNPSVFCDPDPVMLKVVAKPTAPTTITGDTSVCLGYPYSYTTDYLTETTTNWAIVGGVVSGTASTTAIGNSVTVIWNSLGTKKISAARTWEDLPECSSDAFVKTIHQIVLTGQIIGTNTPCEDATSSFALNLNYGATGEVYEWSVSPSSMGSINSGQGTTSCNVTFNHYAPASASGNIICRVTKCGGTTTFIHHVNVQKSTSISNLTPNPASLCSGVANGITFTATTAGASASSFIWDFGDGQTATTTTNQTNHVYTNTTNNNQIFTVSVKVVSSCNGTISAAATTTVIVLPQPNASISPGGVTELCPNDQLPLITTISNTSTGTFSYQWCKNGVAIPGAIGINYGINTVGQYYALITNTVSGCTTKSNFRSVVLNPNCNGSGCTPLAPAGISNFSIALLSCGKIKATCNTAGTLGGNIIGFEWELKANGAIYSSVGTPTLTSSPTYSIDKPGMYQIELRVAYQNSIPGGDPCVVRKFQNIIVPIISDFKWGMACVGNNGYKITLTDNSAVYGNMSVTSRQWKINNIVQGSGSTLTYTVPTNLLGTTLNVEITVDNGSGFPCSSSQTISVPNLPVANFTTVTTNNTFPTSQSCEGRAVVFTNTSSPMATILSNIWDFGDQTSFHGVSPIKEYQFNPDNQSSNLPIVTLTIKDKYNCTSVKSTNLTIDKNDLSATAYPGTYTINPTTPPCYAPGQTVNVAVHINTGSPNAFEWYKEADQITAPSLANINVNSQGSYWVKMYNDKFCFKAINPTPAVVSFRYPIQAIITGKNDVCKNAPFTLKAPKVTGYSYSWVRNPGNVACGTTQTITDNRQVGVYTYTLTLSQNGGCSSTSTPFTVTVHNLPQAPVITQNVVDCDSYRIDLTASSPIASSFTWSTGQNSASIQVAHGGPFRAWLTDQYGCENYADIDVPLAPNTYFWRFPTGCYSFCPEDLPKWVDGPSYIEFKEWEWLISRNDHTEIVDPNNHLGGSGHNSTCAPLWIDLPPLGSGPGNYQWALNTGLCNQTSGIMSVDIKKECCKIEMDIREIECKDGLYHFALYVNNIANCEIPYYNLYLVDGNGVPIGSFSSLSPNTLTPGGNIITGVFTTPNPVTSNTHVFFKIEVFCNDKEHCIGLVKADISPCKGKEGKSMELTYNKTEPNYITELNIAPNPANATLNIGYRFMDENPASKRTIQIFDVVGRSIETISLNNASGSFPLDVSKYMQGIYFVEMQENNLHVLIKRFVVNR